MAGTFARIDSQKLELHSPRARLADLGVATLGTHSAAAVVRGRTITPEKVTQK
jgi:hypothetical protein